MQFSRIHLARREIFNRCKPVEYQRHLERARVLRVGEPFLVQFFDQILALVRTQVWVIDREG